MKNVRQTAVRSGLSVVFVLATLIFVIHSSLSSPLSVLHTFVNTSGFDPQGNLVQSNGALYGVTSDGGIHSYGTVYKINVDGTGFSTLHSFGGSITDGTSPEAGLTLVGNTLYGTTSSGGISAEGQSNGGTIFKINTDGTGYAVIYAFGPSNNGGGDGGLVLSGQYLYGTSAGTSQYGAIYRIALDGSDFQVMHTFTYGSIGANLSHSISISGNTIYDTYAITSNASGVFAINTDGTGLVSVYTPAFNAPQPEQVTASGNVIYGASFAYGGGSTIVFRINTNGTNYTALHTFANPGNVVPQVAVLVSGTTLYCTAIEDTSNGTVSSLNTDGSNFQILHTFATDYPKANGSLLQVGNTLYGASTGGVYKVNTDSTGYANLHSFVYSEGNEPLSGVVQSGNVLYGTTSLGGASNDGTIYAIHPDGSGFTTLYQFSGADGTSPEGTLVVSGSTLYGTTSSGGVNDSGEVFKVNTDGSNFTILHSFGAGQDGVDPQTALVLDGTKLYGITAGGGSSDQGTIFAIGSDGSGYQVLHTMTGTDGLMPTGGLCLNQGVLYGVAYQGGLSNAGTLFKISENGTGFSVLHQFGGQTGGGPVSRLLFVGNALYGLTYYGTPDGQGTDNNSAIFRISADGTSYQVLNSLDYLTASFFEGGLALVGNMLYATFNSGGSSIYGGLLEINLDGTGLRILYNFRSQNDGAGPNGDLTIVGNLLIGTTPTRGAFVASAQPVGTLYALDLTKTPIQSVVSICSDTIGGSRLLWNGADNSASVWTLYQNNGFATIGPTYGPYIGNGSNWHARLVKTAPNGSERLLWTREDGAMGVWSLDQSGNEVNIGPTYGPYSDTHGTWSAIGLGVSGDGTARVLWKRSDGAVGIWWFSTTDTVVNIGSVYGPYPGWTAQGFDVAPNGDSRVLWIRTDRAAGVWTFDTNGFALHAGPVYGPFSDTHGAWSASSVGVAGDGTSHVLWKRSDGAMGLWTFDATDTETAVGPVYGPYPITGGAWAATALGVSPDGTSSVLWTRPDRAAGVWTFDANDVESVIGSVYGPY